MHKLTAGDGYSYLTRQVAAHDAADRGHTGLGDYYSEKGESPGHWWGAGITALGLQPGQEVTDTHMKNSSVKDDTPTPSASRMPPSSRQRQPRRPSG